MRNFKVFAMTAIVWTLMGWAAFAVTEPSPNQELPEIAPDSPVIDSGKEVDLRQLSPSPEIKEATEPLEPDYDVVAEDARKIADEIEQRLIETHMDDAKSKLSESDPVEGYPKADEAYRDMEEMISFCESMSGKAGKACRFKLGLKMCKPGDTLGQLKKGMGPGSGLFGNGQGGGGSAGSQTPFGIFGPEQFGSPAKSSRSLGDKKTRSRMNPMEGGRDPFARDVETLDAQKNEDLDLTSEAEAPIMEEYRPLIEAYFKRLAEEE
ncbi:MAG: hypothetical protein KC944_19635 [Candidatus Omnitrophica bacterium]|nr:hypothetical protein [Candidatus Omnitrophota bacterium]